MAFSVASYGWLFFPRRCLALAVLAALAASVGPARPALGQMMRNVPSTTYTMAFRVFYDGEYREAARHFAEEYRGAIKNAQTRWIDSICYTTMLGECCYQSGELEGALRWYNEALVLYLRFPDWMRKVQFEDPRPMPAAPGRVCPWGVSGRGAIVGKYSTSMKIFQGQIDVSTQLKQGGIVTAPAFYPIDPAEIVRCTALAIRRRTELLGPAARHDKMTAQLIATLAQNPGQPNNWSQCWVDLMHGEALLAGGRLGEGETILGRAVTAMGQFDHPLTSTALLELGRLALLRGESARAAGLFLEAGYSAVNYGDLGVLEEALRYGTVVHLLANAKTPYPPLPAALAWATAKNLRQLHASAALGMAECQSVLGQVPMAAAAIGEADRAIGTRSMGKGAIGARSAYLRAQVLFQQGKAPLAEEALKSAIAYMHRGGSVWLFRIVQGEACVASGAVTQRSAMDLYAELLRDPEPTDWSFSPMESLAVLTLPHPLPFERWFGLAMLRSDHEAALEIADRARRHRFLSVLPYGGRLQSLRWTLEAPREILDNKVLATRQDLLANYPLYDQLAQQARQIRTKLAALPIAPQGDAVHEQARLVGELAAASLKQEALLRQLAVRREPAALCFPPLRTTREILKALPKGQAMLAFFQAGGKTYVFLLTRDKYTHWELKNPADVGQRIVGLLRALGNSDGSRELPLKALADPQWKQDAQQLLAAILAGSRADFSKRFAELVVVPDGPLWYVPFEALQVEVGGRLEPLIARVRVRYAPTAALGVPSGRPRQPRPDTGVVLGRMIPGEEADATQNAFARLAKAVPGAAPLLRAPPPTSAFKTRLGQLIVLDDLASGDAPFAWTPIPDKNPGSRLGDWMGLPWGGPETIILPGFHTAAEHALSARRRSPGAGGSEIFLSVCGMMSCGAQTLLVSRWRTGGQTAYDLVREFAQELPHTTAADAWQRAVLLTADTRLNLAAEPRLKAEPRVKPAPGAEAPRANHPFFWAGYLLIDSGSDQEVESDAAGAAEPALPKLPAAKERGPPADPAGKEGGPPADPAE